MLFEVFVLVGVSCIICVDDTRSPEDKLEVLAGLIATIFICMVIERLLEL